MTSREEKLLRMEKEAAAKRGKPRVQIGKTKGRPPRKMPPEGEKRKSDEPIRYEIYHGDHPALLNPESGRRRPDDPLVVQLKIKINEAGITRERLYGFVGTGEGALFEVDNQAYNLEYGLRKRPSMTLDCARRWLAVLGYQLGTFFQQSEGGWHDSLMQLRDEARAMAKSGRWDTARLAALAEAAVPEDDNDCLVMELPSGPGE